MVDGKPKRIWRIVLVVSLALNLAVVGAVGGLFLRSSGDKGGPRGFDFGLGPVGQALNREDRRAISKVMRETLGQRGPSRAHNREVLQSLTDALRTVPFSEAALDAALVAPDAHIAEIRRAAKEALKNRVVAMSDAERAEFADRIEAGNARKRSR